MSDQNQPAEDFRSQVQRLVAEGKLTAEDAQGLLEGQEGTPEPGESYGLQPVQIGAEQAGADASEIPPNLILKITGYSLTVIWDPAVVQPQLSANFPDKLRLMSSAQGWRVERSNQLEQDVSFRFASLKAILTVPFMPEHVNADVNGGNLILPDLAGELLADVSGGNIRMSGAASLKADVNGGNLNAEQISGPTHLSVNGGNITLTGAHSLNASVNGGNLKWAGVLSSGDHRVEVNAGNAALLLQPGSSVRVDAHVTVGGFKADFPTEKHGHFVTTRHTGQLGSGEATLSCKVAAGQIKVMTQ